MRAVRQTLRGIGYLPHVGDHPGTFWAAVLPLIGVAAGGLVGFLVMAVICWPLYLYGAHDRAEFSDRLEREHSMNSDLGAMHK